MFFEGFELTTVDVPAGRLRLRHGGSGPPLLLLHGNPETHAMWHAVAPQMAKRFTVYCPDLRGYGGSFKPPPSDDHIAYSKVEMAKDMVALMEHFGHTRFSIGSHDRGARVAERAPVDHRKRGVHVARVAQTVERRCQEPGSAPARGGFPAAFFAPVAGFFASSGFSTSSSVLFIAAYLYAGST